MNWLEIREKHPKAFCLLCDFVRTKILKGEDNKAVFAYLTGYYFGDFYERDLYDFFDELKLRCEVTSRLYGFFAPKIIEFKGGEWIQHYDFKTQETRKEAEEHAFVKAFQILEDKL